MSIKIDTGNQPNGSQLVQKDLEQIHEDDLEEIDLKWRLALLSMRARRYFQKTGKKITINRSDTAGLRNQDNSRKTVIVEDTSSKAMVAIDGAGLFVHPSIDLSNSGLEEFKQPEFEGYGLKASKSVSVDTSNEIKKAPDAPIIEDWVLIVIRTSLKKWHMTRNISYLTDFKEHDGGYVAFGGGAKGDKITGKGTIRTSTKDETSRILKSFITEIENLVEKKVKIIRCDNGIEFNNRVMNEFCEEKGIKREYIVAKTPQQNEVAERRNKTLIVMPLFVKKTVIS
nr:putative ribonuclease H-like domain-containing protein [Tanacetum cinerariifolium]